MEFALKTKKNPTAPTQDSLTSGPGSDRCEVKVLIVTEVRHITAVSLSSVTSCTRVTNINQMAGGSEFLD
jgi:hypothetical protein